MKYFFLLVVSSNCELTSLVLRLYRCKSCCKWPGPQLVVPILYFVLVLPYYVFPVCSFLVFRSCFSLFYISFLFFFVFPSCSYLFLISFLFLFCISFLFFPILYFLLVLFLYFILVLPCFVFPSCSFL